MISFAFRVLLHKYTSLPVVTVKVTDEVSGNEFVELIRDGVPVSSPTFTCKRVLPSLCLLKRIPLYGKSLGVKDMILGGMVYPSMVRISARGRLHLIKMRIRVRPKLHNSSIIIIQTILEPPRGA